VKFTKTSLAVAVSISLSACGGGGGGGGGGLSSTLAPPSNRNPVPFSTPVRVNSYQPHVAPYEYRPPMTEIYTRDLNGDGSDEVLWSNAAFEWTGKPWIDSNIQVFGFNTGEFRNETSSWFAPGDNRYAGGFRINFGDFNDSGFEDVFVTTFTDTANHTDVSLLLENTVTTVGGVSRFNRREIDFGTNLHSHDSVVADFNQDGISDVLVTGSALMLGSANGVFQTFVTNQCYCDGSAVGAGLSAADYLGDGTTTVVMTDGPGNGGSATDTILFRPRIHNGVLIMDKIAELPTDRFWLPKWQTLRDSGVIHGHAVRNITMDFNSDGRPDVVVFSTAQKNGNVHGWTEVQFLRNDGNGSFVDVTDSVLAGFEHGKTVSYNPRLIDVNNDGLLDIFMSSTDYTGQSSTSVLLATQEGKFVESYTHVFDAFHQQIMSAVGAGAQTAQPITIVAGPGNTRYLVSGVEYQDNGQAAVAVYASLIGDTGTVTPQATIQTVRQIWPWLSDADANAVLAQSSTTWLNGIPVIEFRNVLNPVGGLAFARGTGRVAIQGHISVPGFSSDILSNVTALDALGRDFRVNLSAMQQPARAITVDTVATRGDVTQNWSSRFVDEPTTASLGFSLSGRDSTRFAGAVSTQQLGLTQGWDIGIGIARMPGSPWMQFSGAFGTLENSTMLDVTAGKNWNNGTFVQGGVMQTTTDFRPGLIERITPLWSAYGVAGWRQDSWSLYGGVQPTLFQGSMQLNLPDSVDRQGQVQYRSHSVQVRNEPVMFVGTNYAWKTKQQTLQWSAALNDQGSYRLQFNISKEF